MAIVANGTVVVSYRPLVTMDELHVLLLAGVSEEPGDLRLLEQVFSLPTNMVAKELSVLEAYGLAQKVDGRWAVTSRGRQIIAVWITFKKQGMTEAAATGQEWLLGPGEVAIDEMIRDRQEIDALAHVFGITGADTAVGFLRDRRRAAEQFEAFVLRWPHTRGGNAHGVFAEALVFEAIRHAETPESLARLEELLAARVAEVVGHHTGEKSTVRRPNVDGYADAVESLQRSGQDVLKRFNEARRAQRKANQKLAQTKATCEAWLAGRWLSANLGSLRDVFDAEPAAFVFSSTVPLIEPDVTKRPPAARAPSPPPTAMPKEEGILRSLFRWLFG